MKIALFSDAYLPIINGVVTSVETLRQELCRRGHEVLIVSNHDSLTQTKRDEHVLWLPGLKLPFLYDNIISSPWQVKAYRLLKEEKLDLIHVHTEFGVGLFGHACAKKLDLPLVYTYHTTWEDYTHYINPLKSRFMEKNLRQMVRDYSLHLTKDCDQIVTPSEKTKSLLRTYGVVRPIEVVPTGINLDQFKNRSYGSKDLPILKDELGFKEDDFILGFVGRIGQEKNLDLVFEAIARLNNCHLKFLVVGDGPLLSHCKDKVASLKIKDQVVFVGRIAHDQVAPYYQLMDAFVSASMTETQGLTFIEAMAASCILLASDKSVLSDLLLEGKNGYYFVTSLDLDHVLSNLLSLSRKEIEGLKAASLDLVQPYDRSVFGERMEAIYQNVLTGSGLKNQITEMNKDKDQVRVELNEESHFLIPDYLSQKLDLHEGKNLSRKELHKMRDKDLKQKIIKRALGRLSQKDYSTLAMEKYLLDKYEEHEDVVREVVEDLVKAKYIDDASLAQDIVERSFNKGYGYYRIVENLRKADLDEKVIASSIEGLDVAEKESLSATLDKVLSSSLKDSKQRILDRIRQKLLTRGYQSHLVNEAIRHVGLDFYDEVSACQKDWNKLYKQKKDDQKVISSLLMKGYPMEIIRKCQGDNHDC